MISRNALVLTLFVGGLSPAAWGDKVTRTLNGEGVPKITIHGNASARPTEAAAPVAAPKKEFQVYQLDGPGVPTPEPAPQVVIVASPPPIAPNPAAYSGYGYGYGYGYGFDYGYGYGPGYPCNFLRGQPLNYQNPPVNNQNPPVNYQNPPVNYQARPLPPGNFCPPRRR